MADQCWFCRSDRGTDTPPGGWLLDDVLDGDAAGVAATVAELRAALGPVEVAGERP